MGRLFYRQIILSLASPIWKFLSFSQSMQTHQKNINSGSIQAGGDVRIGDNVYVVERDFSASILFLRLERTTEGQFGAMLSVKTTDSATVPLLRETISLIIPDNLFVQVADFQNLRRNPGSLTRRAGMEASLPEASEQALAQRLYQTFFSGVIGELCREFMGALQHRRISELLLVISANDERLKNLPWEILLPQLAGAGGLPVDSFGLVRTHVTTLAEFSRQGPTLREAPLKMLFVPALPENMNEGAKQLQMEDELRRITKAIQALGGTMQQPKLLIEVLDCAHLPEITEALAARQHDIVHISGHGAYLENVKASLVGLKPSANADTVSVGVLHMENEDGDEQLVTGRELGETLQGFSCVKLLVLSACETAVGDAQSSTAEQVAAVGIPAVLAMRFAVTDHGARLFTEQLYACLANGQTLSQAMHEARQTLWNQVEQQRRASPDFLVSAEWFTPVLYQNQVVGPLLKPGRYDTEGYDRFYPSRSFANGNRFVGEDFIGRKRLLIRLRKLFDQNQAVCLHGLGGFGKTTTAEAFAALYRQRHPNYGVLLLQGAGQLQELVIQEQLAAYWKDWAKPDPMALDKWKVVAEDPNKTDTDRLHWLLDKHQDRKPIILILDNVEDVQTHQEGMQQQPIASESLREYIHYLLDNRPENCQVLFTTRYVMADLTDDHVKHLPIGKMTFAEQFRYLNYSDVLRKLTPAQQEIVYKRFDGHPRTMFLLEGNLRRKPFDTARLLAEMDKVAQKEIEKLLLNNLYAYLTPPEREVFEAASVFVGRNPLAALCAVMNQPADQLQPLWQALHDGSLCYVDDETFDVHALTRTWMRSQPHPAPDVFKTLSHQAGIYFRDQPTWEDEILAKNYFEQAEAWEDFARAAFRLEGHYRLIGAYGEAWRLNQEVLEKDIPLLLTGQGYNQLGIIGVSVGDYGRALGYLEQSLKIQQEIGDRSGEGATLNNLATLAHSQGDYGRALGYLEQSLKIQQEIGDRSGEGTTLNNLSQIYDAQGDYSRALGYLEQSLKIRQEIGDRKGLATTLTNMGAIFIEQAQDYERAVPLLMNAYQIFTQIGSPDAKAPAGYLNHIIEQIGEERFHQILNNANDA